MTTYVGALEKRIDALITRISELGYKPVDVPTIEYVKLDKLSLEINTSKTSTYSNQIGVFSNAQTVYVFADRTVDGLKVAGKNVTIGNSFYEFNGTITGNKLMVSTSDIEKTGNVILSFNRSGKREDPMDASVIVKIKYKKAAVLPIVPSGGTKYAAVLGKFSDATAALNSKAVQTSVLNEKILNQQEPNSLASQRVTNLSGQLGINTKYTTTVVNDKSSNLLNTTKTIKK